MNRTLDLDPVFAAAVRDELTALPAAKPPRRKLAAMVACILGVITVGGVAVAALRPPGEVATAPLAPPIIVNGIGPAAVPMPPAPQGAVYLRLELACFNGPRCFTAGGGIEDTAAGDLDDPHERPLVQRDALPVTAGADPANPQRLDPVDPASGVEIDVEPGTHWRLYAVYTDGLNPEPAPVGNGQTLGIPSNSTMPDLVPAEATNGRAGWVEYSLLITEAQPTLTPEGAAQPPIRVYDTDGLTVIGEADVSQVHRPR
jgi:hypothetical protein